MRISWLWTFSRSTQRHALLDAPATNFSLDHNEFLVGDSDHQEIPGVAIAASGRSVVNGEQVMPGNEGRAVRMAVDQTGDAIGLHRFVKALLRLGMPPVRHPAEPAEVLEDDHPATTVADVLREVRLQETERALRIVLDAIHALHILRAISTEQIELHEVDLVPIPRIVMPIL